jgi:hypothetical protein
MLTPREEGNLFEQKLYESIKCNFIGFTIRNEREVKEQYGVDVTAIDIQILKNLKEKDKTQQKCVLIQAKWKDKSESVSAINHFIQCCNKIATITKINKNDIDCIYSTKVEISQPSKVALKTLKNSENITCNDMDTCVNMVVKKVAEIYGVKIKKSKTKNNIISSENQNFEDMKKADLISIVMDLYGYTKTKATRMRHAELVQICTNKNISIESTNDIELDDTNINNELDNTNNEPIIDIEKIRNIMKVEYDDPLQRNVGECKSKLLKPGSELYNYITKLKNTLRQNGFLHLDRMGLHSEVLNDNNESLETFLSRVQMLENREIDVKNADNYDVVGRAVALMLGDLDGYNKDVKITIAYFDDNRANDALKCILDNI